MQHVYTFLLLLASLSFVCASVQQEWIDFLSRYNKIFEIYEAQVRFQIFNANRQYIHAHNQRYEQGLSSYYLDINQYADLTHEEFLEQINQKPFEMQTIAVVEDVEKEDEISNRFTWNTLVRNTAIYNQKHCAAGYAFAAKTAVEYAISILTSSGEVDELSAQQIVECSRHLGNGGCTGGSLKNAFEYIKLHGLTAEKDYKYRGTGGVCKENNINSGRQMTHKVDYKMIDYQDVAALENVLYKKSPVAVTIDFSSPKLQFYAGGIFDDRHHCKDHIDQLATTQHMVAIGFGEFRNNQSSVDNYWILKNSLGHDWGQNGYMLLDKDQKNLCGIADEAFVPILDQ